VETVLDKKIKKQNQAIVYVKIKIVVN